MITEPGYKIVVRDGLHRAEPNFLQHSAFSSSPHPFIFIFSGIYMTPLSTQGTHCYTGLECHLSNSLQVFPFICVMFIYFTCFTYLTCFADGTQNFFHRQNLIQRLIIGFHHIFLYCCSTKHNSKVVRISWRCFVSFSVFPKGFQYTFFSWHRYFSLSFCVLPAWIWSLLRLLPFLSQPLPSLESPITHDPLFSLDGPILSISLKFLPITHISPSSMRCPALHVPRLGILSAQTWRTTDLHFVTKWPWDIYTCSTVRRARRGSYHSNLGGRQRESVRGRELGGT